MENEVPKVEKLAGNRGKGRKPGSKNRATLALEQLRQGAKDRLKFPTGWQFLLWAVNNVNVPIELRIRAAAQLSNFELPKLQAIAHVSESKLRMQQNSKLLQQVLSDPDIAATLEKLTFAAGGADIAGLLPPGETGVTGHEFIADRPGESGPGL